MELNKGQHWTAIMGGMDPANFYRFIMRRLLSCDPLEPKGGIHAKDLSSISVLTNLHYSVFTRQTFVTCTPSGSRYTITAIEPMLDWLVEVGTYTRAECDLILACHTLELAGG